MRTNTLLTAAVLGLLGAASASAQVYSVNAVGYVNVPVPKGFSMIANPLKAADNTVPALFASAPDNTTIYKFNGTTYVINSFQFGSWDDPKMTLNPGEGAFIKTDSTFTNLFIGEVMQGNLTNAVPTGFSIQASQVPQAGGLAKTLGYTPTENDTVYQFDNTKNGYNGATFEFGDWTGGEPQLKVGEAFFLNSADKKSWTRQFSVNP